MCLDRRRRGDDGGIAALLYALEGKLDTRAWKRYSQDHGDCGCFERLKDVLKLDSWLRSC